MTVVSKQLKPLMERINSVNQDFVILRASHRAEQQRSRQLQSVLDSIKGNILCLCRVRSDERVKISGKTPLSLVGSGEIVLTRDANTPAESSKMFRFDRAFGPQTKQDEVYQEIGNNYNY
jgi:hypothetical protein